MTPRDALKRLTAAFPNPVQTVETMRLYAEKLGELNEQDLDDAVDWCVERCHFWPRLAELLGRARMNTAARRIRSEETERRARMASEDEATDMFASREGYSEMPRAFRAPTNCETLAGESWTPDELIDPSTGKIGFENSIHARAQSAMRDLLEQRWAERSARRAS